MSRHAAPCGLLVRLHRRHGRHRRRNTTVVVASSAATSVVAAVALAAMVSAPGDRDDLGTQGYEASEGPGTARATPTRADDADDTASASPTGSPAETAEPSETGEPSPDDPEGTEPAAVEPSHSEEPEAPAPDGEASEEPEPVEESTTEPSSQEPDPEFTSDPDGAVRMVEYLNERRRELGLPEVAYSSDHEEAAYECASGNLAAGTFGHCGHEVLYLHHGGLSPEDMIDGWFYSDGHRTALTYDSSRNAGAAIVSDESGTTIVALNIDY